MPRKSKKRKGKKKKIPAKEVLEIITKLILAITALVILIKELLK